METITKQFIGKDYADESQKKSILKNYNEYQLNKLAYLNKMYDKESTLIYNWRMYKYILPFEEAKGKDLMYFDSKEIEGIIASKVAYREDTKFSLFSFCNLYCQYNVAKGNILFNPCDNVDKSCLQVNKLYNKKRLYSLDYIYNEVKGYAIRYSQLHLFLPILLARYGIKGEELNWMRNLKYQDIDEERKIVNIYDHRTGELITELPIDDRFIETVKEIRSYEYGTKLIQSDYLVKLTEKEEVRDNLVAGQSVLHNRNNKLTVDIKESGIKYTRISFNDLIKTRQFELLLKIRSKRRLISFDLERVSEILYGNSTQEIATRMRRLWKVSVDDDKIYTKYDNMKKLVDDNAEEFAKKIADIYGINLDEIPLVVD